MDYDETDLLSLRATWDPQVSAGYIYFQPPETRIVFTRQHDEGATCNIDYDEQGDIVGIELLL